MTPAKAAAAVTAPPAAAALKSVIADAVALGAAKSVPVDGTPIGPIESAVVGAMAAIDRIDTAIYGTLDATANWLSGLPATPVTEMLQGTLLLVRRTFFDQAPTVNPVQQTGQVSGPITGTLGVTDPEKEAITYKVVQAPTDGTVVISADGKYVYTPGADFTGSDAFVIEAVDKTGKGLQGNVLEPRRQPGTEAFVAVNQGTQPTITFDFSKFKKNAQAVWEAPTNTDALPALEYAAEQLAKKFVPKQSVTLYYELGVANKGLASAGSDSVDYENIGFFNTVVQNKIINGPEPDDPAIDGNINFNFQPKYTYYGDAAEKAYSFQATATHEILHSFGFLSSIDAPSTRCNEVNCNGNKPIVPEKTRVNWQYFDQFAGPKEDKSPINSKTGVWDPAFNKYITGGGTGEPGRPDAEYSPDGLYFWGKNAVAEFGGPVPLYSPKKYIPGSSLSHLSDYYFNGKSVPANAPVQLMNADGGPGEKNLGLSKVEIAMLKDLGYTMR